MKVFIVDICNCLELSHYETFFFKDIKEGRISLFPKSLSSIRQLDEVQKWLKAEINRNPFSIKEGLVVFYIPRNLLGDLSVYDYDNTIKMYIHELVAEKLDNRFKYACVFLDQSDENEDNTAVYLKIKKTCDDFYSDDSIFNGYWFNSSIDKKPVLDTLGNSLNWITDDILHSFYRKVFDMELASADNKEENLDKIVLSFINSCKNKLQPIRIMRVAHYAGDIAKKTEMLINLICYVCNFVRNNNGEDFDLKADRFVDEDNFKEFHPDLEQIKQNIVNYRARLSKWLSQKSVSPSNQEVTSEEINYAPTNKAVAFKSEIENITLDIVEEKVFNPSFNEIINYNVTEQIFEQLDDILENASKKLNSFCKDIVDGMIQFRKAKPNFRFEDKDNLTADEADEEKKCLDALNTYYINDLPGYPAEIKLRQELDEINLKIQYIAERVKKYKTGLFLGTGLFALLSVLFIYLGAQNTVFSKENTWWIFFIYNAVVGATFSLSYFLLRRYYRNQVKKLLLEAKQKVNEFLENYKKRAEEFEKNINNEMMYYCKKDKHDKLSANRNKSRIETDKFNWHKTKIKSILKNLSFFDGFTSGKSADLKVDDVLSFNMFEGDAEHCDFYQLELPE